MKTKIILAALGIAGFLGKNVSPEVPSDIHGWLRDMHVAQVELLKINLGQPGFCTKWDRDYDPATRTCGRRGKELKRKY